MADKNACIYCSKQVQGELILRRGWLGYDVGGFAGITHRHNLPEFYKLRSRKSEADKLEAALTKLMLNPGNKQAAEAIDRHMAMKLLKVAKGTGMEGVRAMKRCLELFVGEEPATKLVQYADGRMTPTESPLKNVVVHILPPEPERAVAPIYKEPEEDDIDDDEAEIDEEDAEWTEPEGLRQPWQLSKYPMMGEKPRHVNPYAIRDWGS